MDICSVVLPKNALQNSPKKKIFQIFFFWDAVAAEQVQGGEAHGRWEEKKEMAQKTAKKIRRAALCHTFILFGGSKATTSNSNSNNNNFFWRGAGLAGPPVTSPRL